MNLKALGMILLAFLLLCLAYNAVVGMQPATATLSHPQQPYPQTDGVSDADQVVGPPSLTAAFIDQVLAQAASPARGLGQTLYQLSLNTHIDDAVALSFFHHESDYGKFGMAASTRSLGNIRCTVGYQCDPTHGYRAYRSWADGARDWFELLQQVYLTRGLDTISKIIPVYAPAADHNDEAAYIHSVLSDIISYRHQEVQA